ncbi:hypothetical protein EXIGLDRAFT_733170 [Exidia glandulosa HHB12029]|uniref:Uncharacterized protein n=1 Tax=Exidia glandulosa HHB12029 TaxID=1314781 RepID=A0A165KKT2_EXIGL|nr:hypothetical protein EXIGLDRAFT_733170 [Exidia glandulosa HHB12029]
MRYWALRVDVDSQKSARVRQLLAVFPVELLRSIFLLCTSQPDDYWPELDPWPTLPAIALYNKSRVATPLRLATVCRRWRAVALDAPDMWCYIGLPALQDATTAHAAALHARVLAFLDRSKRRPLHILLSWADGTAIWTASVYYAKILASLEGHCARWERVRMALPSGAPQTAYDIFRNPTPMLVEFDFLDPFDVARGHFYPTPYPTYLPICPRILSFTTHTMFVVPMRPLSSLLVLCATTSTVPLQALWDALKMMPSLEVLDIKFEDLVAEDLPPTVTIPLTHLTRLAISGDLEQFSLWLPFLDMPSVDELRIFADSIPVIVNALDALADRITRISIRDDSDSDVYHLMDEDIISPAARSLAPNLSLLQLDFVTLGPGSAEALASLLLATALPPDVTDISTAESPRCRLKVKAIDCDMPSWLEKQINFAAATMDGRAYDPVIPSPDESASPESEEEEAQFTDGSGEDYTSDGEWSESSNDDDELNLDG